MRPVLTVAPPAMTVRAARDLYLSENGFTTASYTEEHARLSFFGLPIVIKNSEGRKRGLPCHDLHHVALGFGTDLPGECEISAWELRTGAPGYGAFVWYLLVQTTLLGLLIAPLRTVRAFRAAARHRSLYRAPLPMAQLLEMDVAALRAHLGLPEAGLAAQPPRLHPDAPAPESR